MSQSRIASIETVLVDLPLVRPHRFPNHAIDTQSYLLVVVRSDCAVVGVGEGISPGGPWWSGESVESQEVIINRYLAPALVGLPLDDDGGIHGSLAARGRRSP